jgi:hypothetical protein
MRDAQGETEAVVSAVRAQLSSSTTATSYLGDNVYVGLPVSSMSSSTNINGIVQKSITLILPVSGRVSNAFVRVVASVVDGGQSAEIRQLILQTPDGRSIQIIDRDKGTPGASIIDV